MPSLVVNTWTPTNTTYSGPGDVADKITGLFKGAWARLKGLGKPERKVEQAGVGDYRLLRKDQPGHQRLNVVGVAPVPQRAASLASTSAARVIDVRPAPPAQAPAAASGAVPTAQRRQDDYLRGYATVRGELDTRLAELAALRQNAVPEAATGWRSLLPDKTAAGQASAGHQV